MGDFHRWRTECLFFRQVVGTCKTCPINLLSSAIPYLAYEWTIEINDFPQPIKDESCQTLYGQDDIHKRYIINSPTLTSKIFKCLDTHTYTHSISLYLSPFLLFILYFMKKEAELKVFINNEANDFNAMLIVYSLPT